MNVPLFPTRNVADGRLGDTVQAAYLSERRASGASHPDVVNDRLRQLPARSIASLADAVSNVVAIGAKKQVGRIDALAVIAAVADMKAITDITDSNHVHRSVSVELLSSRDPQCAVAAFHEAATPEPACICVTFGNLRPKAPDLRLCELKHVSILALVEAA